MIYNVQYKCDNGEAPTEATVDMMFRTLDRHISYRIHNYKLLNERINWCIMRESDDMVLQIIREVK